MSSSPDLLIDAALGRLAGEHLGRPACGRRSDDGPVRAVLRQVLTERTHGGGDRLLDQPDQVGRLAVQQVRVVAEDRQRRVTGAHVRVTCEKCHARGVYVNSDLFRGKDINTCTACHRDPHERRFDATCTSCHTTEHWDTRTVNHARTRFPLVGAHAQVACASCHRDPDMTKPVRFDQCSACHTNPHRDSVKGDCNACHTEQTFRSGRFDHTTVPSFTLTGKHETTACQKCHIGAGGTAASADAATPRRVVDFKGAETACVACHLTVDPHKGNFGRACDACHSTATFVAKGFAHPREPDFYGGQHQPVGCEKCHKPDPAVKPARATAPAMACAACHRDVHLGQVANVCERCHDVKAAKFAAPAFHHDSTAFALTGKHLTIECVACHKPETRAFPAGRGTAVAYKPTASACTACHKDPHLGQFKAGCESCHTASAFKLPDFRHTGMDDFFGGFHGRYGCASCHKSETRAYPAGRGAAVRYIVGRTCGDCHPGF